MRNLSSTTITTVFEHIHPSRLLLIWSDAVLSPPEGWYLRDFSDLDERDILVVLMLDGWQDSIGVALEIAFALGKGIPIYYCTLKDVLSQENVPF